MEIPLWRCPKCFKTLPWTAEKEIEEHDCFLILDTQLDDDKDLFALDEPRFYDE